MSDEPHALRPPVKEEDEEEEEVADADGPDGGSEETSAPHTTQRDLNKAGCEQLMVNALLAATN